MARDQWVTSTGLLDDFEFEITEAYFATDARYNNGETLMLHWLGKTDNEDQPILDANGFHPSFPCGGNKWVTADGGKTARNISGKTDFTSSSYMGRLIHAALEMIPQGTPNDPLEAGAPTDASIWVGCRFHMKEVSFDYGGEIGTKSRLMPVAFLGAGSSGVASGSAVQPASPAAAAPSNGSDPVVVAKLTALAKAATSHPEFQSQALGIPEVATDNALLASIVDDTPTGFYASANS